MGFRLRPDGSIELDSINEQAQATQQPQEPSLAQQAAAAAAQKGWLDASAPSSNPFQPRVPFATGVQSGPAPEAWTGVINRLTGDYSDYTADPATANAFARLFPAGTPAQNPSGMEPGSVGSAQSQGAAGNPSTSGAQASVNYNGHQVSDARIRAALQAIADEARANVNVTSGDRNFVPPGGARNSQHLFKKAADFHVVGMTDDATNALLHGSKNPAFSGMRFIQHGPFTKTQRAHVHMDSRNPVGTHTIFMHEGMVRKDGKYIIDGK